MCCDCGIELKVTSVSQLSVRRPCVIYLDRISKKRTVITVTRHITTTSNHSVSQRTWVLAEWLLQTAIARLWHQYLSGEKKLSITQIGIPCNIVMVVRNKNFRDEFQAENINDRIKTRNNECNSQATGIKAKRSVKVHTDCCLKWWVMRDDHANIIRKIWKK